MNRVTYLTNCVLRMQHTIVVLTQAPNAHQKLEVEAQHKILRNLCKRGQRASGPLARACGPLAPPRPVMSPARPVQTAHLTGKRTRGTALDASRAPFHECVSFSRLKISGLFLCENCPSWHTRRCSGVCREVGLLVSYEWRRPSQQSATTASHHCIAPACLNGCPVLAYEKDPVTGIVRHLDDQCIGCQYCVLKCPYDVPKYSAQRGIVRKCDMCHGRLAVGEAPACVQACPSSAISIQILSKDAIRRSTVNPDARLLPGSCSSAYTQPATRYLSRKALP